MFTRVNLMFQTPVFSVFKLCDNERRGVWRVAIKNSGFSQVNGAAQEE